MNINQQLFRTIWADSARPVVHIIDQTKLPFAFEIVEIADLATMAHAIRTMQVRGAPLIGAAAAFGLALQAQTNAQDDALLNGFETLKNARPTAVNLVWALERVWQKMKPLPLEKRAAAAWQAAQQICEEDIAQNLAIGQHGFKLIEALTKKHNSAPKAVNILTHCNAGWLATVDGGTALAPIYAAHNAGLQVHVWIDETRPRNQGASLTAWELVQHGVPHTIICDNAGGHLMQQGLVDMVIVGADRVTAQGDVCNKIGTYLKALAAHDNAVPFYAAVPSPTIDWQAQASTIEIEARDENEVHFINAWLDQRWQPVRVTPEQSRAFNPAFDITPARLVTAIITERGVFRPEKLSVLQEKLAST